MIIIISKYCKRQTNWREKLVRPILSLSFSFLTWILVYSCSGGEWQDNWSCEMRIEWKIDQNPNTKHQDGRNLDFGTLVCLFEQKKQECRAYNKQSLDHHRNMCCMLSDMAHVIGPSNLLFQGAFKRKKILSQVNQVWVPESSVFAIYIIITHVVPKTMIMMIKFLIKKKNLTP